MGESCVYTSVAVNVTHIPRTLRRVLYVPTSFTDESFSSLAVLAFPNIRTVSSSNFSVFIFFAEDRSIVNTTLLETDNLCVSLHNSGIQNLPQNNVILFDQCLLHEDIFYHPKPLCKD